MAWENPQIPTTVFWITLGLFLAISTAECLFAFFEKDKPRMILKTFCVGVLVVAAILISPNTLGILVMCGALLGAIGDLFLIFKGKLWCFLAGTGSFLLGHVCYIFAIAYLFQNQLQWYHPLIFVLIHLIVWALSIYPVHKIIKSYKLCIPGCFYLSTLFMFVLFSFFVAGMANEKMLMVAIGATIFLSSDIYLVKCNFYKHSKREDFFIMLLYLPAKASPAAPVPVFVELNFRGNHASAGEKDCMETGFDVNGEL
ncbi:MAG: hypothetical protein J5736_05055, partial [Bacilli bacterium]|nr:hypothetical protein [Bacilli bacterium]